MDTFIGLDLLWDWVRTNFDVWEVTFCVLQMLNISPFVFERWYGLEKFEDDIGNGCSLW